MNRQKFTEYNYISKLQEQWECGEILKIYRYLNGLGIKTDKRPQQKYEK